ncbi:putative bifunctional UDP-N-acetylglucosamine transferase and deubiquitinase ALG13 [Caerostris darwini]|uniref:Bifunctional UDP-N-acetylglucosamine transferase and deubiquitinase ALG13 n=1 Tax=Caerostris darwini TaxID=1538125 RepID=A0AAV4MPQ4_9ARAC|nr:putative bifunctional UDP-N-acetylglucosamine transferase and deubiquitinase ALG13 [Caerostris darwini]
MDGFLNHLGLYRSDVAKDYSSLFRVVSEQLFYTQVHHVKLREGCMDYMERYRTIFEPLVNEDFDEYLKKIRDQKEWAGEVEMKALSLKYKIDFVVYYDISKPPLRIKADSSSQTISLACTGGNRYDCVYSKSELSTLAFCQSIVYEVLYKKVYELGSDVDVAVEKMLHDKAYSKQRRNNLLCHFFRDSCRIDDGVEDPNLPEDDQSYKSPPNPRLEIRKALAQGIPPFPYKVAKTLDPSIYRNVEFDMWNEKRKEDQKNEHFFTPDLEPGVKCKVHINRETYIGYVQEVSFNGETVLIYIEELCKRCILSSSALEIVPVPAYKALTWQGGKTYKVYSDCVQPGSDMEKNKMKKNNRRYQDNSPSRNNGHNSSKSNIIARSNSLPAASTTQRNSVFRCNSMHSSAQFSRKKTHGPNTSLANKPKSSMPKDARNVTGPVYDMPSETDASKLSPADVHYYQPIRQPQNFPFMWNGMPPTIPSPPIPIPGKVSPDYYQQGSPEMLNELNDSVWIDESYKLATPSISPPQQFMIAPTFADPTYSTNPPFAIMSANPASLPIPGTPTNACSTMEEASTMQPVQCPTTMALYPYPMYAVSGMYLLCRDGSALPVNIGGTWGTREALNGGEVPPGVPSMYFNTPPSGMSPPMTSWIQGSIANYGSTWPPAMSSVAFTPPLEMNAYQPMLSPPWSPQSGFYIPPPTAVAYQVQPPQVVPQEAPPQPPITQN